MHPNQLYRSTDREINLEFVRKRAFGVLAVNGADGPLVSHIPFLLSKDGATMEFHLVRSNPIARLLAQPTEGPCHAVMAVSGGDSYVSPDWYGMEDQVPTWNYVSVHLRGVLEPGGPEDMHGVLERISAEMEGRIADKQPWKIDKVDPERYNRMLRQIVPVTMRIEMIDSTWKLSQNKPASARRGASIGVRTTNLGSEVADIARLMDEVEGE